MELQAAFDLLLSAESPLKDLDALIWQSLSAAATLPSHPWGNGCLTTMSTNESKVIQPRSRTVVVRDCNTAGRTIDCYTDVRSAKVAELDINGSAVCWLFYYPSTKMQLRLQGTAVVINDSEVDATWEATALQSRSSYLSIEPPGKLVASSRPPETGDRFVNHSESERGRENFRVIRTQIEEADWLYLRQGGHVRASLRYLNAGEVDVAWTVP